MLDMLFYMYSVEMACHVRRKSQRDPCVSPLRTWRDSLYIVDR